MGESNQMSTRRSTRGSTCTSAIVEKVAPSACARKRKNKTEDENENPARRQKLAFLTNQLDLEVEMRCQRLRATSQDCIRSMSNELEVTMMRLPKHIRQMSVSEFKVKYQGTVSKVKEDHIQSLKQTLDTPRQMALRSRTIACTPSSKKKMVTPARKYGTVGSKHHEESAIKPREIEVTMPMSSRMESPMAPMARPNSTESPIIDMNLLDANVEACVDDASKAACKDKLKAMQAHLAALMQKIENSEAGAP